MARFRSGERVRVPQHNPHAYSSLHGRQGVVTISTSTVGISEVRPGGTMAPLEDPPLLVRFDGDDSDTSVNESWLEVVG